MIAQITLNKIFHYSRAFPLRKCLALLPPSCGEGKKVQGLMEEAQTFYPGGVFPYSNLLFCQILLSFLFTEIILLDITSCLTTKHHSQNKHRWCGVSWAHYIVRSVLVPQNLDFKKVFDATEDVVIFQSLANMALGKNVFILYKNVIHKYE